jgi:hypothetical protein
MRFRTTLAGVLVCALALVAALAVSSASARLLQGRTAQKYPIKVAVNGGKLKLLHFKAKLSCADGSVLIDTESGFQPTRIGKGGAFSDVQVGSTDEVILKGRVKGRVVQGKVRVVDHIGKKKIKCHSRLVKFTAKPKGGKKS